MSDNKKKIIFFTGAGISKSAGIPTFEDNPKMRDFLSRDFAKNHSQEYNDNMKEWAESLEGKLPTRAHELIAESGYPVLTMNVDRLHELAGSKGVLHLHGELPEGYELEVAHKLKGKPVLYGDQAPNYRVAINFIINYQPDYFVVVGSSRYTSIVDLILLEVVPHGTVIKEFNTNADEEVQDFLLSLNF